MIGDLIKAESPPPPPPRRRRRRTPFWRRKAFLWLLSGALILIVTGVLVAVSVFVHYRRKAHDPEYDLTKLGQLEKSSVIFDRHGEEIGSFFVMENRRPVPLQEVPQHLIYALVSEEDSRFFEHNGVDYWGIGRAVLATLKVGRVHQGASTITQQLARQAYGMARQKTIDRKFTEIFLARRIEDRYSKQQILELYLNRIYFGRGFYGINAAALGYFGKPVTQLSLDESAILVGLIKSPNRLSPLNNPQGAVAARNQVLYRMQVEGYLTQEEYRRLRELPLKTAPGRLRGVTGYVQAEVRQKLIDLLGYDKANTGGYRVYTTMDADVQRAAEKSLSEQLARVEESTPKYPHETPADYRQRLEKFLATGRTIEDKDAPLPNYLQGAVMVLDNHTGAILAMVGGRDFTESQYNRAIYGRRPAGTAFIPMVYGAAFEHGAYPGTRVKDTPLDNTRVMIGAITGILGEWGSENPSAVYQGDISSRQALVYSRNGATVRLGAAVGLEKVKDFTRRAGIQSPLREENKAYLGSSEVTPAEMALAYSTFAGQGKRPSQLYLITKIENDKGEAIYTSRAAEAPPVQATDEVTAYQVHSCLRQALTEGPGGLATTEYGLGEIHAAGKTGTHSSFTDLWFAGYTSRVTCTVWVGLDKPGTIFENAFSNRIALPVWVDVMEAAAASYPGAEIPPPPNSEAVEVCQRSGLKATDNCYEAAPDPKSGRLVFVRTTYNEVVRPGYKVTQVCDVHSTRPEGDMPFATSVASLAAPITNPLAAAAAASAVPVIVHSPPVVAEVDPYQAVQPVVRTPRALPVDPDLAARLAAGTADSKVAPLSIQQEKGRVELPPPTPIRID